jgi:toxin HigB-1
MIKSWKHKGLRNFYLSGDKSGIIFEHKGRLQVILQLLDAASKAEQLDLRCHFGGLS